MTPEEHLLAAADDMAEHGQCKGSYFKNNSEWRTTSTCALGSLGRVAGFVEAREDVGRLKDMETYTSPAARKLANHLRARYPGMFQEESSGCMHTFDVITIYNDADDTTAEDMILAMKQAAHDVRQAREGS